MNSELTEIAHDLLAVMDSHSSYLPRVISIQETLAELPIEQWGERILHKNNLHLSCESEAERNLLEGLLHLFEPLEIQSQVVIGKRRVDFVTGRIGWEIDGKEFHNEAADQIRDLAILKTGKLDAIIRIPAGAYFWFPFACRAIFVRWLNRPLDQQDRSDSFTFEECQQQADLIVKNDSDTGAYYFVRGEARGYNGSAFGFVGSPFSMLPADHPIGNMVPEWETPLHRHTYRLEYRSLENASEWNS